MKSVLKDRILVTVVIASLSALCSSAEAQQQPFMPTVPINVPPGTRGMQPNLALVYSPTASNGPLGVGWGLSGVPAITRINYGNGINFDTANAGADTYAHSEVGVLVLQTTDGTYRSKKESLMRFQPQGACGDGPCSWIVTDRSGTKYFYGDTTDSRLVVTDGKGVKTWALSRVQDLFGNFWSVTYDQDYGNGQLYPWVITYTQGPGLTTFRTVELVYDRTRTDTDRGYYSSRGYIQATTRRLAEIQIKSGGALLRKYVLSYEISTTSGVQGRSRLRSVQEQDAAGNSLPPQRFTYEQGVAGFSAAAAGNNNGIATPLGSDAVILSGDFDGDGKTEPAYIYRTTTGMIGIRIQRSSGAAGAPAAEWAQGDAGPWLEPLNQWGTFLAGDFNGDGKTDIAFVHSLTDATNCHTPFGSVEYCDAGQIEIYQSTGNNFVKQLPVSCDFPGGTNWPLFGSWMTGDFDGNGTTDIAFVGASDSGYHQWPTVRTYSFSVRADGGFVPTFNLPYFDCDPSCKGTCSVDPPPPGGCCQTNCPTWDIHWQQHATVLTGDYDGDGRTDIMVVTDGGPPLAQGGPSTMQFLQLNSRSSIYARDAVMRWGSNIEWKCGTDWQQCGTFLTVDFNGDGKTDLAYLSQTVPDSTDPLAVGVSTDILFWTGVGLSRLPFSSSQEIWQGGRNWQSKGTFLKGDFDGDGKADLAYAWNNNGQLQIDVALGTQSNGYPAGWSRWLPPGQIPWFTNSTLGWQSVASFLTGDFDGQGKMDVNYAYLNGTSWSYVNLSNYLGHPLPPDVMTDWDNGIGGTQHVEYFTAPNAPNAIQPWSVPAGNAPNTSPQLLVKSLTISDGRGGSYTTNYSYQNAQIKPGPIASMRNLGFQRITATDAQTSQSIMTEYSQTPGYEGLPMTVYVRNGLGQYMRVLSYSFNLINLNISSGTEFAVLTHEQDATFEQSSSLSTPAYSRDTYYGYDGVGNVHVQQNYAPGLPEFDIVTDYQAPDPTNWILARAHERSVSSAGLKLQDTIYTWQNNTLTAIDNWFDAENRNIRTSMSYDANGRMLTVTEPAIGDGLTRTTTITSYDDTFHAYPKVVTDAKGFTTQRTYTAEGELATFADQNNELTRYDYDGFGRRKKETRADGGTTTINYYLTGSASTEYTEAITQVDATTSISEKSYFDGSGFVYRTERTGDSGPICVFRQKDSAGRVGAVSNPTFNCGHGGDVWTNIAYESAGRPYRITTPDGRMTTYSYEASNAKFACANGRLEHVFDANGRETTRCIDARERTASVTDPLGQVTAYGYDVLGRATSVNLPGGMSSTINFDSLGRKTSISDSQVGLTRYAYYDNGNLKSTVTGDNALTSYKTVSYVYDVLNRVTQKNVSDSQTGAEGPVTFTYDETAFTDAIGRLTTVTGNNGLSTHYSYSKLGQPNVIARRIVNSWTGTTDIFTEAYTYDLGGRLTKLLYPEGSTANYYYSVGGNLQRVDLNGITRATWSNYDAFGAPLNVQYQNTVKTAYSFDVMHHLTGLATTKDNFLAQAVYQNLTFDWYATQTPTNGLVLGKIQDSRSITVINGIDTSETQTYWYDATYRLATASGVWGTRTYSYDTNNAGVGMGNPTSFGGATQRTLSFAGTKLSSASDGAGWSVSDVTYDTSGNMIHKNVTSGGVTTGWVYKWTGESRLASATFAQPQLGSTTSMLYDDAGQRFMKHRHTDYGFATPDDTTVYVGKEYEKRISSSVSIPTKQTLHLFANGQLIMSWTQQGGTQTAFNDNHDWRTEIAAASMYDARTVRGLGHKLWHLARAGVKHPNTKPYATLTLLALFCTLALSSALRRQTRYSRRQRFAAASLLMTLGFSACSGPAPQMGESTLDVLRGSAPGVGTFFYHRNHINSSAVITDASGNEVSRMVYLPFGEIAQNNSVGSDVVTDKYTGQEADAETGLYYYNARYYDPTVGRFLSADPLVGNPFNAQAYNRYAYTRNNPISSSDPSGLCPQDDLLCLSNGTGRNDGSSSGWLGAAAGVAGALFNWIRGAGGDTPNGPKRWSPPTIQPGTPSTPVNVDQNSSGNASGTLTRAQAINQLAALKVKMASQRLTPEAIAYYQARGTVNLLGGLDSGWGTYIADHPVKSGAMIFGGVFVLGVSGGVGVGLATGTLEVGGGTLLAGGAVGTVAAEEEPQIAEALQGVEQAVMARAPTVVSQQWGGVFTSQTNAAGGTVWTSAGNISQNDFAGIVNNGLYQGSVNILTGVHGTALGKMIPDASLYAADVARFGNIAGVNVYNLLQMGSAQITALLNGPGTTIGGFCNSGICLAPFK